MSEDDPSARLKLMAETLRRLGAQAGEEHNEDWARDQLGLPPASRSPDISYVAIERAVVLGGERRPVEGRLYRQEADGTLTPLDGAGLRQLYERYPEFLTHWRLDTE